MDKSIPKAFTFMFEVNDWLYKLFLLTMLYLPFAYFSHISSSFNMQTLKLQFNYGHVAIFALITGLALAISTGYLAKCTQNIIKNDGETPFDLPNWEDNFISFPIIGLKKGAAILVTVLLLSPTIVLFAIPLLIFSFIFLALDNVFCVDFDTTSYFAWKKATSIIVSNNKLYYLILLLAGLLSALPSLFCLIKMPPIPFVLLLAFCMAYSALVYAYFIGIISRDSED